MPAVFTRPTFKRHAPGTPSHRERAIIRKIPSLSELMIIVGGMPMAKQRVVLKRWEPYLRTEVKLEIAAALAKQKEIENAALCEAPTPTSC